MEDMNLTDDQRFFIADKLMDSANVVLGFLVIGQIVSSQVKPPLLILGVLIYFWCWSVTIQLRRREKGKGGGK